MNIFLATSFEAKEQFHHYRNRLLDEGHNVPDWTTHKPIRPYRKHLDLTSRYADRNLDDVVTADCFILIADARSKNALVEFGAAIQAAVTTAKPAIIVVGDDEISMYCHHAVVRHATDFDGALALIKEMT